jgi:hypothetical protein
VQDGAVGSDTRRHERIATGDRASGDIHRGAQGGIRLCRRAACRDEALTRNLVARRHDDTCSCVEVGIMHGADFAGLVRQDPRGPQGVPQVMAPTLQLRGQTTVDWEWRTREDVVDADRNCGAQM